MRDLKFLNKKEKNKILEILEKQFGFANEIPEAFVQSQKNNLYLISRDIDKIDMDKVRINNVGLYFGEIKDDNIRLSIEGSQIVGPYAKKDVIELNEKELEQWIQGVDIENASEEENFVILKHKNDFVGCGKIKNKKIFNFIPKNRRLKTVNY